MRGVKSSPEGLHCESLVSPDLGGISLQSFNFSEQGKGPLGSGSMPKLS